MNKLDPKRIVAKSIHRQLTEGGLSLREQLAVATELLGLIAERLRAGGRARPGAAG